LYSDPIKYNIRCKEKTQANNKQANRTNEYNKIIMENWK
jgi:hypothetical protein